MANPAFETVDPPYSAFRFEVALALDEPVPGVEDPVCNAAFQECDGLEVTMEPRTFQQGGDAARQIHLVGPVRYGQLSLRRGMTANLNLWTWFAAAAQPGRVSTAQGEVTLWDAAGEPRLTFVLEDCLPVRMRGPSLHARDGIVAVEEMQLVYARLSVRPASAAGLSAGLSVGAGVSFSASAGVSVSGGAGLSGGLGFSANASASVGVGIE